MALRTPPSWLQNGSHPAENDRLTTQALYSATGIIGASSLAITAQSSPNMTVNAATGWCAVLSSTANGGVYVAYNDAVTVLTITAANASLPRIDRIVVTVSDAYYSGATNTVAFQVLAGTPNVSPTAPATPSDSISLATIAVAAAATSIGAANITDTRTGATSTAFLSLTGGTVTGATTFSGALTLSNTVSASAAITSTSTITASSFTPSAGTTSVAPLKLTSGTNLTAVQAGAVEFDGTSAYFTPNTTSGRGIVQNSYVYSNGATTTGLTAASTALQNFFGVSLALLTNTTYEIDVDLGYQTVGGGNVNITLQYSNTVASIGGTILGGRDSVSYTLNANTITAISATTVPVTTTLTSPGGTGYWSYRAKLYMRTSGAGNFYIGFTAASNFTTLTKRLGSFVKVTPVSNSVGAWA